MRKIIRRRGLIRISHNLVVKMILALISWMVLVYILVKINPIQWASIWYAPFFGALLMALYFSFGLLFKHWSYRVFISIGLILILFLRLIDIDSIINVFLILGLCGALIYFFTADKRDGKLK